MANPSISTPLGLYGTQLYEIHYRDNTTIGGAYSVADRNANAQDQYYLAIWHGSQARGAPFASKALAPNENSFVWPVTGASFLNEFYTIAICWVFENVYYTIATVDFRAGVFVRHVVPIIWVARQNAVGGDSGLTVRYQRPENGSVASKNDGITVYSGLDMTAPNKANLGFQPVPVDTPSGTTQMTTAAALTAGQPYLAVFGPGGDLNPCAYHAFYWDPDGVGNYPG
ncbi:MAG: hypothetical protein P4M00_00435 [Azospirillaceae bacterium]|nr:hypothetical protein [Azospirillaceae bacterium]